MSQTFRDRYKLTFLAWLATVLTAFAFLPALSEKQFIFSAAFVSALVVLVGVGLRTLRTPALLVLAAQLVALVEILLVIYGHELAYGLIPTGATFDLLNADLDDAMNIAQTYAAPAPPSPGLTLMVVFYVGLIAALVDFCAITMRRVPLAGLPLLALYSVPVASLPHGVPFLGFLPGAIGFVAMLMVDERDRLAHWGRLVARDLSPDPDSTIDTSGLAASGRRISSLALATAVIVPIFVPVLSSTLLNGPGDGTGNGKGNVFTFTDPMVSLASSLKRKDPVDILTVTGDTRPQYLRLAVLDQPGPNAWTVSPISLAATKPANSVLPLPTGQSSAIPTSNHDMTVNPTAEFPQDTVWLPVPFGLRNVNITSDWSYVPQSQVVTANDKVAGATLTTYELTYDTPDVSAEQLAAAGEPPSEIKKAYGQVPPDLPDAVREEARAVTVGASSPFQQAVMLQSFFQDTGNFTYDLNAGYGYGYQAMTKFLDQKRGFCQHFAATMAMMARVLGIPSRVVVGFLQPERTDSEGWVFTSHNVHAWPELYFSGVGWVKFEPTPSVGAPQPSYTQGDIGSLPTTSPSVATQQEQTTIDKNPQSSQDTTTEAGAAGGSGGGGNSAVPSRWWLVAAALVLLACLPAVTRLSIRRRRLTRPLEDGEAAEAAWLELRDRIIDLRLPWTGSMTPRARQRSVEPMLEGDVEGRAALRRLTLTVERSRYALSIPEGSTPAEDARTVMGVISRTTDPMQRVRALVWPSSLIPDLRVAWQKVRERRSRPLDA